MRLSSPTTAALAVVALLLAACSDGSGTTDESERDVSGDVVEGGDVGVFVIQVGDCFDDPGQEIATQVPAVPCDEPHDFEAVATFDVDGGEDFPGEAAVGEDAEVGCLERFEGYVGSAYADSALFVDAITPTAESWEQGGDREVICMVFDPSGELTGSVEQSGL